MTILCSRPKVYMCVCIHACIQIPAYTEFRVVIFFCRISALFAVENKSPMYMAKIQMKWINLKMCKSF